MRAKSVEFDVTYVNLREKPDWFLAISPHGKVPVLKVDEIALFESNAIAEFLDEVVQPRIHPEDPIKRAQHRAWTDYVPTFCGLLGKITYCKQGRDLPDAIEAASVGLARLEGALRQHQPADARYFWSDELCLVDAAYAPFFQRFQMVEDKLETGVLSQFPRVAAWVAALLATPEISGSVHASFATEYAQNLHRRGAHAAQFFEAA
jgi:glutathione S-transferase